jgi:hypothetical protein
MKRLAISRELVLSVYHLADLFEQKTIISHGKK